MGTNYYLSTNYCFHCKRGDEIHLGKSSVGWVFLLKHNPEHYKSWEDMKGWLLRSQLQGIIRDEYGEEVELKDFIEIVEYKQKMISNKKPSERIEDSEKYCFILGEFS